MKGFVFCINCRHGYLASRDCTREIPVGTACGCFEGESVKEEKRKKSGRIPHNKVEYDGYTFDSGLEHERYLWLKDAVSTGEISGLEVHPRYEILLDGQHYCWYTADFRYRRNGELIVEDVKSKPSRTRDYMMRKKAMRLQHGIIIQEWPPKERRKKGYTWKQT